MGAADGAAEAMMISDKTHCGHPPQFQTESRSRWGRQFITPFKTVYYISVATQYTTEYVQIRVTGGSRDERASARPVRRHRPIASVAMSARSRH